MWVCVRVVTTRMLPDVDYLRILQYVSVDVMESNRLHCIGFRFNCACCSCAAVNVR